MSARVLSSRSVTPLFVLLAMTACGGSSGGDKVATRGNVEDDAGAGDAPTSPNGDNDSARNDDDSAADDDSAMDDDTSTSDDDTTEGPASLGEGPLDLPAPDVADLAPPEPLLPDTPPETPVSDLGDEEFSQLCEPYLDEATTAATGFGNLCGFAGITAANDAMAATVEEYQRACGEARIQCESDSAAVEVLAGSLECTRPEECTATVQDVEACYQNMRLLNAALLEPLGGAEFPPCEELTPEEGGTIAAQLLVFLLLTGTAATAASGMPIDESAADPCEALETTCPGLAAPAADALR